MGLHVPVIKLLKTFPAASGFPAKSLKPPVSEITIYFNIQPPTTP